MARQVARLARLDLDEPTLVRLSADLSSILAYVEALSALELDGDDSTSSAGEGTGRAGERGRVELSPGDHLRNAPDAYEGAFRVPRVL